MIGYWLIPAEPHRTELAEIVRALAATHDAPVFEPHVTLYSNDSDKESARVLLDQIARQHRAVELAVGGVDHSEKFTKTLFLQFENTPEAQQLSEAIRAHSASEKQYEFDPHLSLIYVELPADTKLAEARAIHDRFERVRFDALAAIEFPRPIKSRADVEAWRTIATATLSG